MSSLTIDSCNGKTIQELIEMMGAVEIVIDEYGNARVRPQCTPDQLPINLIC